ncbi:HEPN domain-containing protein [Leptolyngbya sp. KIOST-1]|uniref:HEPN domain-containing protein n=1 Tax=Leptolyngbya sp. KIOST-1 TaxID=1229172 RepID=UPI00068C1FF7|nr:HEPN domain-containing protein [Leptolyngbya sp. KIOST-1]
MNGSDVNDDELHEVQQWLAKSRQDLQAAHVLIENSEPLFAISVYHCQQSAEKALKGYLTYQGAMFQKTHNLIVLVNLCIPFDADFHSLQLIAATLTPYGSEFRYPGDLSEPSRSDTEQAIDMAVSVLDFVIQRLP